MSQENESSHSIIEFGYWVDAKRKIFTRNHYTTIEQEHDIIKSRNNYGIYKTAFSYNNQDVKESTLLGDLYLDFDAEDDFELARKDAITTLAFFKVVFKLNEEDVLIYFSGKKGLHLIIPKDVLGIEPHKHLHAIFKTIAKHLKTFTKHGTLDLVIYEPRRLFRVANSQHEKTNLFKIQLAPFELKEMSHADIIELAKQPRAQFKKRTVVNPFAISQYKTYVERTEKELAAPRKNIKHGAKLSVTPPCVQHILEHGSQQGMRNNTAAALASFYKAKGLDLESAYVEMGEWNSTKNSKPLPKWEMKRTVQSIYNGEILYGCTKLKEVSTCDEKNCPLVKQRGVK